MGLLRTGHIVCRRSSVLAASEGDVGAGGPFGAVNLVPFLENIHKITEELLVRDSTTVEGDVLYGDDSSTGSRPCRMKHGEHMRNGAGWLQSTKSCRYGRCCLASARLSRALSLSRTRSERLSCLWLMSRQGALLPMPVRSIGRSIETLRNLGLTSTQVWQQQFGSVAGSKLSFAEA